MFDEKVVPKLSCIERWLISWIVSFYTPGKMDLGKVGSKHSALIELVNMNKKDGGNSKVVLCPLFLLTCSRCSTMSIISCFWSSLRTLAFGRLRSYFSSKKLLTAMELEASWLTDQIFSVLLTTPICSSQRGDSFEEKPTKIGVQLSDALSIGLRNQNHFFKIPRHVRHSFSTARTLTIAKLYQRTNAG